MNPKTLEMIGWFASLTSMLMYASYVDQIRLNIAGQPGSVLLPLATCVNCFSWMMYAYLQPKIMWPIFSCNALGIVLSVITVITALS